MLGGEEGEGEEKEQKEEKWREFQAEILEAISFWDSNLCSREIWTYLVQTEDCQSPIYCTWRLLPPEAWRWVAPPLLRLCPENFSGEKPALARRDFSLAVKFL